MPPPPLRRRRHRRRRPRIPSAAPGTAIGMTDRAAPSLVFVPPLRIALILLSSFVCAQFIASSLRRLPPERRARNGPTRASPGPGLRAARRARPAPRHDLQRPRRRSGSRCGAPRREGFEQDSPAALRSPPTITHWGLSIAEVRDGDADRPPGVADQPLGRGVTRADSSSSRRVEISSRRLALSRSAIARADARVSRQPRFPHLHTGPPSTIRV